MIIIPVISLFTHYFITFAPRMCILEPMKIDLKGLKEGLTEFQFGLDDGFFKMVDAQEVNHGTVQVTLSVQRTRRVYA